MNAYTSDLILTARFSTMHTCIAHVHRCGCTMGTYRVDMVLCWGQIRYLLSEPVTCPIYVVSGGIPRDSPPNDDILRTMWLCLPHLILISQSAIRSLLGHTHHAVMIGCVFHWIGLILAPTSRQGYLSVCRYYSSHGT